MLAWRKTKRGINKNSQLILLKEVFNYDTRKPNKVAIVMQLYAIINLLFRPIALYYAINALPLTIIGWVTELLEKRSYS